MANNIRTWLDFAFQQIAAESYLDGIDLFDPVQVRNRLRDGNNDAQILPLGGFKGFSRLTENQAQEFTGRYQIVNHHANDSSGFSATLLFDTQTQQYTLSFRSTEYLNPSQGGDFVRDGLGAGASIKLFGFAFAQINAMERYYNDVVKPLIGNSPLNITGYSLGGHLATVFTELHADAINHTYVFNGAGQGAVRTGSTVAYVVSAYQAFLQNPGAEVPGISYSIDDPAYQAAIALAGTLLPRESGNIYNDARYIWAAKMASQLTSGASLGETATLDVGVSSKITRLFGHATHDDTEGVATLGIQAANPIQVFIEDQPNFSGLGGFFGLPGDYGNTHSLTLILDSLALMDVFQKIDPSVSQAQIQGIFAAASNQRANGGLGLTGIAEGDSLESPLDALRKLYSVFDEPTKFDRIEGGFGSIDRRTEFYANLSALANAARDKGGRIVNLVPEGAFNPQNGEPLPDILTPTAADLLSSAAGLSENGIAYRYALHDLNPFVVIDTQSKGLYARFETGGANAGELDLYDPASEQGRKGLTEFYLKDRADFLERKLYITALNLTKFYETPNISDPNSAINAVEARGQAYQREARHYEDRESRFIASDGSPNRNSQLHYIFGRSEADVIEGAGREDHLYGGAGNDVLAGRFADDYLEGGSGFDTYSFTATDGTDTVLDADGKGVLTRNGNGIALGIRQDETHWAFGSTTYTKAANGTDLEITFADNATDKITINNFDFAAAQQGNYLAVRLVDAPTVAANPVRTFFGDKQDWDSDPDADGIQPQNDGLGNSIRADGQGRPDIAEPDRADLFYGEESNEVERFTTAGGDDEVRADGLLSATSSFGGRDLIETGVGRDIVVAGAGDDWVEGGTGVDILFGNAGNDALYAQMSSGQTLALAQAIAAGETEGRSPDVGELLTGDAGQDLVFGAATDDLLLGGEAADIVIGGGGDDTLYGDWRITTADRTWTIQRTETVQGGKTRYEVTGQNNIAFAAPGAGLGAADTIYGGAGLDWVFAGDGDDYIDTGNDNDVAFGEAGSDVLIGGAGDDVLSGDNTLLVFGPDEGADYLDGGAGNDTLLGDGDDDILYGGAGEDYLGGGTGADILLGGSGTDILAGGAGKDTYIFNRGDGIETVLDVSPASSAEASVLVFGEDISRADVKFRVGSLMVDLGNGDVIHFEGFDPTNPLATPLLDSIQFADGSAMTYQDVLDQGFDIEGTEDDDVIDGTAVTDRIDAKGGNDNVSGRTGDDTIIGSFGNDILLGEGGNDTLSGGEGIDSLDGDWGDDVLAGGDDEDEIFAGGGNDVLDGGSGDDRLIADSGADVLTGGAGNDFLIGNEGSDVYALSVGDGRDAIDEQSVLAANLFDTAGVDVVRFAEGIAPAEVNLLARGNGDLIIRYGADDRVTIRGQYRIPGNAIERIEFADGTVFDSSVLNAVPIMPIEGTAGDDLLYGTDGNDTLLGFAGDDVLDGGRSPDEAESPVLLTDNDRLEGGAGADTYAVYLGMGTDTIVDASETPGETGTLELAAGLTLDSVRTQRRGDDLFVGLRSGQEGALITGYYDIAAPAQNWQVVTDDGTATPIEEVINRPDPNADDIAATAKEDYKQNLLSSWSVLSQSAQLPTHALVFNSWSQTVTVVTLFTDPPVAPHVIVSPPNTSQFIEQFGVRQGSAFAPVSTFQTQVTPIHLSRETNDIIIQTQGTPQSSEQEFRYEVTLGSVVKNVSGSISTINLLSTQPGVSSTLTTSTTESWRNITLALDPGAAPASSFRVFQRTEERVIEEITAGNGDNQIHAAIFSNGSHVALIDAGGGNDIVNAGAYDFVYGNEGSDRITGGRIVYGGNDSDALIDGATLYGGAGSDSLFGGMFMAGGEGDDFLSGKSGATVFFFDPAETGEDFVEDLGGVNPADFSDWYYGSIGVEQPQEHVEFAGMYVVGDIENDTNQTMVELSLHGDTLGVKDEYASNSDMDGLAYFSLDDLRFDLARFNIPYRPSDIRFIEPLPPVPVVTANDYAALEPLYAAGLIERDTVEFGEGVGLDDVATHFDESGNLALTWGAGKVVHVTLPTATDLIGTGIERFKFADGATVSLAEMLARAGPVPMPTITGTENGDFLVGTIESERIVGLGGADIIRGFEGEDQLEGGNGNDSLQGDSGNDTLDGGTDSDFLSGGEGDDVYGFGTGDGIDFVFDEGGGDAVRFAPDVVPRDVGVTNDPYGTLHLVLAGTGDRILLQDWFGDPAHRVENVEFADGTIWDTAELQGRVTTLPATEFGDILTETENDDTVDGLGGNDEIYGLGGDDVLAGGAGDDYMEGGAGNDIMWGGDGADGPSDWQGNNFLEGGTGDDNFYADGAPNFVDGGSNFVVGGAGNDFVGSYAMGNVIAFNAGDGQDMVYAANSFTLSLGGGIAPSALSLSQEEADLVLTIGANDSIRLTRQFEVDPEAWPRITLQLFGSVHFYDFNAVIADFRQAVAADPLLQKFALGAVLQGHQTAVSETDAFGGALAHRYATTGDLNGLSDTAIQQVLGNPDFGTAPQAIRMERANNAPVLDNPIADQFAIEDTEFRFVAPANTFGDSDHGDTLIYSSTRADGAALPEWLTFNKETRTFSGLPVNESVGTVAVRMTASDGAGASVSDVFGLTVANTNDAPVLVHTIADQSASTGVAFEFTLATDAFRDIDRGEVLVYRATLTNGDRLPAWLRFDAARRNFSGTPAATDAGAISIRVTVSDQVGTSAADDFQLVVPKCATGHEVDPVGMDHAGDRGRGDGKRDDGHGRKRDDGKHDDHGDDRLEHKGDRIAQWFAACIESEPRYDFEALAQALEPTDRHGGALNEHEIARRWRAVGRYANALSKENDEDARSGVDYRSTNRALLDGGAYGDGFGNAATGGAPGRVANFQTLRGLEEGFQRLHS